MAWYDQPQQGSGQQRGMSPQQMMQFGLGMLQPRPPNQPPAFFGSQQPAGPYGGGGGGGQQTMPNVPDPLDAYSDDDIAKAYAKRQSRARIGNKSYGP